MGAVPPSSPKYSFLGIRNKSKLIRLKPQRVSTRMKLCLLGREHQIKRNSSICKCSSCWMNCLIINSREPACKWLNSLPPGLSKRSALKQILKCWLFTVIFDWEVTRCDNLKFYNFNPFSHPLILRGKLFGRRKPCVIYFDVATCLPSVSLAIPLFV